jgi:hypothetical protein
MEKPKMEGPRSRGREIRRHGDKNTRRRQQMTKNLTRQESTMRLPKQGEISGKKNGKGRRTLRDRRAWPRNGLKAFDGSRAAPPYRIQKLFSRAEKNCALLCSLSENTMRILFLCFFSPIVKRKFKTRKLGRNVRDRKVEMEKIRVAPHREKKRCRLQCFMFH